jgi:CRP-like cAMP-binding protein
MNSTLSDWGPAVLRTSGPQSSIVRYFDKYPSHCVPEKTAVFHQEDEARSIYVVRAGQLSITACTESGNEVEVGTARAGALLGTEALYRPRYLTRAECLREATVIVVPRKEFRNEVANHPALAMLLFEQASSEVCALRGRLLDICGRSALQRLAMHLLDEAGPGGVIVKLPWGSRCQMAKKLTMSHETLSRAMHELMNRGQLLSRKGEMQILDREALIEVGTC